MKTRKLIKEMRENFIRVNAEQEKGILKYWGENIENEFTEQDISEQTRKIMQKYEKF